MEPRVVEGPSLQLVGMEIANLDCPSSDNVNINGDRIPQLWGKFGPRIRDIPNALTNQSYGVCFPIRDNQFSYLAAVAVTSLSDIPQGMVSHIIPSARYAVFEHLGYPSGITDTFVQIFESWLPQSGHKHLNAPDLEVYPATYDPALSSSVMEIWIPIK